MRLMRNRGMSAEEFSRRMAVHQAHAQEVIRKNERLTRLSAPFIATLSAARDAGCRVTRWHVTPEQRDEIEEVLGQRYPLTILGYPVVVDRKSGGGRA